MRRARTLALVTTALLPAAAAAWSDAAPADYGRVTIDRFSSRARMAPVQFDHWRHRALYTCRLCHVDIGFAMAAGATEISAATNQAGFHCAACHGRPIEGDELVAFPACDERPDVGAPPQRCGRCHSRGDAAQRRKEFATFASDLPRRPASQVVDWERAEATGRIRPSDQLPGVSIPREPLVMDAEVLIATRGWMTDVLFSHPKHAVWNGCEVCHPEIFSSRRQVRSTMLEIHSGQSCGACHGKVAFSIGECERCHVGRRRAAQ